MENEKYKNSVFAAGNLEDELEEILKLSESHTDVKETIIGLCGFLTISGC
ncbi:MAG TPA: hypothetical protein IAB23_01320 [Candidatus Scybalocola faecavium]|nr:hypothetical protein [Candidatus Scybalocola faecavium]